MTSVPNVLTVALNSVPRLHPEAAIQRVGGQYMAATDDHTVHTFEDEKGISEVAERIVALIDGQRTVAGIIEHLCKEFEVPSVTCSDDTIEFLRQLAVKRIVLF